MKTFKTPDGKQYTYLTVKELREALQGVDEDLLVVVPGNDGDCQPIRAAQVTQKVRMHPAGWSWDDPYMAKKKPPVDVFELGHYL